MRLSASERRLLGRAAVLLGLVRVLLRRAPLQVVLSFARATVAPPQAELAGSPPGGDVAAAIVRAVERAARLLPGTSTCLARALVAQRLLRCAGVPAELRLGVAPMARPPGWRRTRGSCTAAAC
ncbi:MAG: lasso peptide biosynthesis B2 protein [Proteobacteria bacterium]|nr:lasso peptide biosynthesis B2 protein [Pseudomonadota bacterium]